MNEKIWSSNYATTNLYVRIGFAHEVERIFYGLHNVYVLVSWMKLNFIAPYKQGRMKHITPWTMVCTCTRTHYKLENKTTAMVEKILVPNWNSTIFEIGRSKSHKQSIL